jgi:hypothetical protein
MFELLEILNYPCNLLPTITQHNREYIVTVNLKII